MGKGISNKEEIIEDLKDIVALLRQSSFCEEFVAGLRNATLSKILSIVPEEFDGIILSGDFVPTEQAKKKFLTLEELLAQVEIKQQ